MLRESLIQVVAVDFLYGAHETTVIRSYGFQGSHSALLLVAQEHCLPIPAKAALSLMLSLVLISVVSFHEKKDKCCKRNRCYFESQTRNIAYKAG